MAKFSFEILSAAILLSIWQTAHFSSPILAYTRVNHRHLWFSYVNRKSVSNRHPSSGSHDDVPPRISICMRSGFTFAHVRCQRTRWSTEVLKGCLALVDVSLASVFARHIRKADLPAHTDDNEYMRDRRLELTRFGARFKWKMNVRLVRCTHNLTRRRVRFFGVTPLPWGFRDSC